MSTSIHNPLAATLLVLGIALVPVAAGASELNLTPSPLLSIDQNRATVVERIVAQWGDALAITGAGLTQEQLESLLSGLRSDQLLAASLAGSLEGLRNVIANALTATAPVAKGLIHTKALGDATDDLVYTPVTPCREADTRLVGGPIGASSSRDFKVWVGSGGFAAQGGSASNCNIPANPVAVVVNLTAVSPAGAGNFIAYATGTPSSTSVLNYQSGISALASGAIVPVCQPACTNQLTIATNGAGADLVMDIVGYFKPPSGPLPVTAVIAGTGLSGGGTSGTQTLGIASGGVGKAQLAVGAVDVSKLDTVSTDARYFKQGGNALGATAQLGTTDNQPLEIYVNGERVMRYEWASGIPSVIGGYSGNSANGNFAVTIAGGGAPGTDCGEQGNVSCSNQVTAPFATIGGGFANSASGVGATISGGFYHVASGDVATIAGGIANVASGEVPTVGGGSRNSATGFGSVVAGGINNVSSGSGTSTVSGGANNTASGLDSVVAGGMNNSATGFGATVVGGLENVASGDFSFASGLRAKAVARGTFVWADAQPNPITFEIVDQNAFAVRATGGVRFVTAIDGTGNPTKQVSFDTNGNVIASGTFNPSSDRNAKEGFTELDARAILDKVAALHLTTWRYKTDTEGATHMGPMAQDFHAAFGLGVDDKHIATVDADGVALAAIQGLNAKVDDQRAAKDAEIGTLKQELAELRRTVEVLIARTSPEGRVAQLR